MTESRREFLVRVLTGTAYAAPVVLTMAAPDPLAAQASVSQKDTMDNKMKDGGTNPNDLSAESSVGPSAPWEVSPP